MPKQFNYIDMYQGGGVFGWLSGLFGGKKTTSDGSDQSNMDSMTGGHRYSQDPYQVGDVTPSTSNTSGDPTSKGGIFSNVTSHSVMSGLGGLMGAFNGAEAAGNLSSPSQKAEGIADNAVQGVSSVLGMLGPVGSLAGAALNVVNGVGGSLMNNNSTAKAANNFKLNSDVMQSSSYGGITSGATSAMADGQGYKKSGLFGKLFTNTGGLKNEFNTSAANQTAAAGVLKTSKTAMDGANASADMFGNNLVNKDYNSQMWNNGSVTMGKDGIKIKPSHEGKFTAFKKRTGETTAEAKNSSDPHVRKMATFAANAAKWKHQHGGKMGVPRTTPVDIKGTGPTFGDAMQTKVQDTADKPITKQQQITANGAAANQSIQNVTLPGTDYSSDIMSMVNQALAPAPVADPNNSNPGQSAPVSAAELPAMQGGGSMSTSGSNGDTMTYATTKKKLGTPVKHQQGGVMQKDATKVVPQLMQPNNRNYPGTPIKNRDDFDANWFGNQVVGDRVDDGLHKTYPDQFQTYGRLTDLYRYFSGQPLQNNVLSISANKPTNAKDPDARYIAINDPEFRQQVVDNYSRAASGNLVHSQRNRLNEFKIRDNTYDISAYSQPTGGTLGHYVVSKGKDNKGDYVSYYDKFDIAPGKSSSFEEDLGMVKPFEVYDRIYVDPNGKILAKQPVDPIPDNIAKLSGQQTPGSAVPTHQKGGAMNVIPDGALHAHRHRLDELPHLEDAAITNKGIPVVSFTEGGEVSQHAEIEAKELILHYDLTKKLEALMKEGGDESALEAGKLLAREIVKNTKDKSGVVLSAE